MNPSSPSTYARLGAVLGFPLLVGLAACSSAFSAGANGTDASVDTTGDESDGGGIIIVPESGSNDSTTPIDSGKRDAANDARHDGPEEAGMPDGPGCPTGDLMCGSPCVPSNLMNCGTCGHDCSNLPHVSGSVTCTASGACSFPMTSCAAGWADCDGNPDNGCEADTTMSPNCGGCNVTCSGTTSLCNGTGCVSSCMPPTPDLCGSTCTDKTSDPLNCGMCGANCNLSNPA